MRRLAVAAVVCVVIAAAAAWALTRPAPLAADALEGMTGDAGRGERVFWAGGCAGCHAAEDAEGEARLKLGGGRRLATQFGTFVVPNISSDPEDGIGEWSAHDLADAMLAGVSPEGRHYYPVFPYTSYQRADLQDVVDLKAFLDTLPAVAESNPPHELIFPFNIRRALGLWKRLFTSGDWVVTGNLSKTERRGRYLVESLGHCGECHTPRGPPGNLELGHWLAGGPNPVGEGKIPDITPAGLDWSQSDIAYFLKTGLMPDYDTAGGAMVEVIDNVSQLSESDRAAIAAYLKAVPASD